MEFKLKPFSQNLFPKGAVMVCHASPRYWLQEIQQMGINLNDVAVFAKLTDFHRLRTRPTVKVNENESLWFEFLNAFFYRSDGEVKRFA